uniref:Uncharacterized protein n=1 Tax=Anguilla anguilla TaxID=7936 RepID=A0A0E9TUW4_ANGAN
MCPKKTYVCTLFGTFDTITQTSYACNLV